MTEAAFIGYGALVALAFGVRTVLHFRRTGRHGWLPSRSRIGAMADAAFTLGLAAAVAGPASALLGAVDGTELGLWWGVLGLGLVYGGAVFALVAQAQMGEAWRAGVDVDATSPLVVKGLFGISRNPFYLGMILATAGVALAVPQLTTVLALVLVYSGSYVDARFVEEPVLLKGHGDAYRRYRDRTPRFWPRTWRSLD